MPGSIRDDLRRQTIPVCTDRRIGSRHDSLKMQLADCCCNLFGPQKEKDALQQQLDSLHAVADPPGICSSLHGAHVPFSFRLRWPNLPVPLLLFPSVSQHVATRCCPSRPLTHTHIVPVIPRVVPGNEAPYVNTVGVKRACLVGRLLSVIVGEVQEMERYITKAEEERRDLQERLWDAEQQVSGSSVYPREDVLSALGNRRPFPPPLLGGVAAVPPDKQRSGSRAVRWQDLLERAGLDCPFRRSGTPRLPA